MSQRWTQALWVVALTALWGGCARAPETPPPSGAASVPTATPGAAGESSHTIGEAAASAALGAKVKTVLIGVKGLDTGKLDVEATADGVVTLKGKVPSAAQKRKAEATALRVEGVRSVRNALVVAP